MSDTFGHREGNQAASKQETDAMKALGLIAAALIFSAPAVASAQSAPSAGKVWSTGSTYHCPGTRYFGTTKTGSYVSEAAKAKAAGATKAKPAKAA